METKIEVDNLKCGGCAHSIEKGLLSISGVDKVVVLEEKGEVIVSHKPETDMKALKDELNHLGYPEVGTTEGLEKISRNVKSYVSCAIGKLENKLESL